VNLFDDIILISEGKMIYNGDSKQSLNYFK